MFSRLGVWSGQAGPALLELLWSFFGEEQQKGNFPFEPVFLSVRVRAVSTIFAVTYEEMSQFYACVFWPWDVMMMLFSELYTMLVPLFLPDRHWIVSTMLWSLRYSDQNWWHIRARNVKAQLPSAGLAPFPIPYDPWIGTDQFDGREQAAYWLSLTEFEQYPSLGHFRSVPDLLAQLRQLDPEEAKRGMRAFNEATLRSSLDFYRWAAASLLGNSLLPWL